jgi:hypothetical protein
MLFLSFCSSVQGYDKAELCLVFTASDKHITAMLLDNGFGDMHTQAGA